MKAVLAIAALMLSSQVFAQEQEHKFYVFGNAGSSSINFDKGPNDAALIGAGAVGLSSTVNDTAGALMVGAGYRFVPQASVELAYIKTSNYDYKATFAQGTATDQFSGNGFGVNLVGYAPLGEHVDLYGKIGVWSMHVDETATISAAGFLQMSQSSSNTTPMFGIGVEYKVTPQFGIRAEYDHFSKVGDDSTIGSSSLGFLSVGVSARF